MPFFNSQEPDVYLGLDLANTNDSSQNLSVCVVSS